MCAEVQCSSTSPAANVSVSAVMSGAWCLWHEIILVWLVNIFINVARKYQMYAMLNAKITLRTFFFSTAAYE